MKRTRRLCAVLTALVLCCALCLSAAAEKELFSLADQGAVLLLHTDNVTIRGHAEFDLDGVRFKTADVVYIQEGSNSLWQLDLLTPRAGQPDKASGFTVIANGMMFYTMERLRPGTYRSGTDSAQDAILRHSTEAETLGSLAASLADMAESQLAPGALTVSETENGEKEYALEIGKNEAPFLVNTALNLYAEFALHRFMGVDYDAISEENQWVLTDYDTITQGILYGTRALALDSCSVKVRTDEAGQIIAAGGTVRVQLDCGMPQWNLLEVRFDATVSDYGTSKVGTFNPNDYGVVEAAEDYYYEAFRTGYDPEEAGNGYEYSAPAEPSEADPEEGQRLADRTAGVIAAAGFDRESLSDWSVMTQDGFYEVNFLSPEDSSLLFEATLTKDGNVFYLNHCKSGYYDENLSGGEPEGFTLTGEQLEKLNAVLEAAYPGVAERCASWTAVYQCGDGENDYIVLDAVDGNGDITGVFVTLRLKPDWQVVTMSLLAALY